MRILWLVGLLVTSSLTGTVQIPELDESVCRLGFGCSSIMGRVGRRASLDALARAFDGGVTYFDVARSYGYGNAEKVVGEFLRGRRDRCVVATKVGIEPSIPSYATGIMLPVLRALTSRVPRLQALSARRGERLSGVSKGHFDPQFFRQSLDTSLSELGTDYVDLLLLHEVAEGDLQNDELLRLLQTTVESGRARAIGIATSSSQSLRILDHRDGILAVQVPSHVGEPCPPSLIEKAPFLLTHTAMGLDEAGRAHLAATLDGSPDLAGQLKQEDFLTASPGVVLPELLLAWALVSNPAGITLCGMLKPEHVASNLSTLARADRCAQALRELGRLHRKRRPSRM